MAWNVTADLDKFDEAIAWFASRVPYDQARLDTLDDAARSKAFTIAGAIELRAVQTILDEMAKSVEDGTPYEDFVASVEEKLDGKVGISSAQLETVFRTNVQTAYNAGRWFQIMDPEVTLLRPFLMYDSVLDTRTTEICQACDGTVKSHFDPWWETHNPPLHHRCRSSIRSLRRSEAERRGITDTDPAPDVPGGFGKAPTVADKNVAMPKSDDFSPDAWSAFERRHALALSQLEGEQIEVNAERAKRDQLASEP